MLHRLLSGTSSHVSFALTSIHFLRYRTSRRYGCAPPGVRASRDTRASHYLKQYQKNSIGLNSLELMIVIIRKSEYHDGELQATPSPEASSSKHRCPADPHYQAVLVVLITSYDVLRWPPQGTPQRSSCVSRAHAHAIFEASRSTIVQNLDVWNPSCICRFWR